MNVRHLQGSTLNAFRDDVRRWLDANCPPSMRTPMPQDELPGGGRRAQYKNPETKLWLDRMAESGWTVSVVAERSTAAADLTTTRTSCCKRNCARINARPALSAFGIWMIGPALLEFANEEQKSEHLPKIARGEIRWCQGYSEPGAGSDLAGVETRADDMGDSYLVNGSKIWTSYADQADWIFCLVRTNSDGAETRRHQLPAVRHGITRRQHVSRSR